MASTHSEDQRAFAAIAAALTDICRIAGIETESSEYQDVAQLLAHLYKNGYRTTDQLKAALDPAVLEARFG